jgi:2-amino-4-hydroxy-6-hydroxymethyldihydropteridine diphosphokinase
MSFDPTSVHRNAADPISERREPGLRSAFLGIGSNLGDRVGNVRAAVGFLSVTPGIRVERVSSYYETSPIGPVEQSDFVNVVAMIETAVSPSELLDLALGIEKRMGRVRDIRWGPRVIDIDILLYDGIELDAENLKIPHPRMMERAFVMVPLAEIAPDLRFPDGRMAQEVALGLSVQCVTKLSEVA